MALNEGIVARLLESQVLHDAGPLPLFEALRRFGAQCRDPKTGTRSDPVDYYQANATRGRYYLTVNTHDAIMSILYDQGFITLRTGLDYIKEARNQAAIETWVQLTDALVIAMAPKFACLDLGGDIPDSTEKDVEATTIQWLFWANYFGSAYIDKFGKDFFLQAPGAGSEELPDGSIKYLTRSNPRDTLTPANEKTILDYFSQEHEVKMYSFEQFGFM